MSKERRGILIRLNYNAMCPGQAFQQTGSRHGWSSKHLFIVPVEMIIIIIYNIYNIRDKYNIIYENTIIKL